MKPLRRIPLNWLAWQDVALYFARDLHGRRILDFGCGQGQVLSRLNKDNMLVGVDVRAEALNRCRTACGHQVHLARVGTGGALPFQSGAFEAALAVEVIEHVPDDRRTVAELARVVAPGGLLILSTPHRHWLSALDLGNLKFRAPRLHRLLLTKVGGMAPADFDARYGGGAGLIGDVSIQENPWHRHYSLADLKQLLAGRFQIERYYIFAPMARIIWPVATAIGWIAPSLGRWLKGLDHASRRCFASQGYDICVVARRCPDGEGA